jgi:hypothetical protein
MPKRKRNNHNYHQHAMEVIQEEIERERDTEEEDRTRKRQRIEGRDYFHFRSEHYHGDPYSTRAHDEIFRESHSTRDNYFNARQTFYSSSSSRELGSSSSSRELGSRGYLDSRRKDHPDKSSNLKSKSNVKFRKKSLDKKSSTDNENFLRRTSNNKEKLEKEPKSKNFDDLMKQLGSMGIQESSSSSTSSFPMGPPNSPESMVPSSPGSIRISDMEDAEKDIDDF